MTRLSLSIDKIFFFFMAVIIVSCGGSADVQIDKFSPDNDAELLSNIEVVFNRDIAPPDKQGEWTDTEYLTFDPQIEGKFIWHDGRTLYFSPDVPLEPMQEYKVKVNNNVLFGQNFTVDFPELKFRTKSFIATGAEFFWSPSEKEKKLDIRANLKFNYPVAPSELKKYLSAELEGEWSGEVNIKSDKPSETIAVELKEITPMEKAAEIKLTVKQGLKSVYGKDALNDDIEFEYELPAFNRLSITGVSSGFDGNNGWIDVYTSQMADADVAEKYISIEPAKKFTVSVLDNKIRINLFSGSDKSILLNIKKGLPGEFFGELEFDFVQMVSLVDLQPDISFATGDEKYLLRSGERNITVNCVNIKTVDFEASQIFANNLVHFLSDNSYYSGARYKRYYNVDTYGKVLYEKEVKLSTSKNWLQEVNFNLDEALKSDMKGIYIVQARSHDSRWMSDSRIISLSDNGIIVRKGENDLMVFINRLSDTNPVGGASVKVLSSNNVTLFTGTSDENGVCRFDNISEKLKDYIPAVITVEKDGDFNFIDLSDNFVETSRFDTGGLVEPNANYKVFLYGPRNIYRPGEKVTIAGIIRDNSTSVLKDLPLKIKITTPDGKTFNTYKTASDNNGGFELSFDTPDFAMTGQYFAEVTTGAEILIGSYRFSVEDFVPDKVRVNFSSDKSDYKAGEKVAVNVTGEFLYGAPASNLKYTADFQFRNSVFTSKKYSELNFAPAEPSQGVENFLAEGRLDEKGKATVSYNIPELNVSSGVVKAYMFYTLFDLTGRPMNKVFPFTIYTRETFAGLSLNDYYFSTGENIKAKIAVVDKNDKDVKNVSVKVELVKYEWQSVLKKNYSDNYYYDSEKKAVPVFTKNVNVNGIKEESFQVNESGSYELRVYNSDGKYYVSNSFYAWSYGNRSYAGFEVDKEGRINIVADKESYEPGDKAKLLFTTPFDGKMLVTFEREGVFTYKYADVKNKSAQLEVDINEEYLPNVYVTATLFRAHTSEQSIPLLVAHGYKSVSVKKAAYNIPVKIEIADKVKPQKEYTVKLKTGKNKKVKYTLAIVDEGILQLKNFETPDPYAYMYARKPLVVQSFDIYDQLLPEIVNRLASTGGDALAAALQKRSNPVKSKRFKLVSMWSGIKETNSSGEAQFTFKIPQFNGELRVMALVYDGKSFGSADKAVKVSDDIIIEPEFPRVLTLGDTLTGVVNFVNASDKNLSFNPEIKVTGNAKLVNSDNKKLTAKPGETVKASYKITSANGVGTAAVEFSAKGDVNIKNDIDFAVRPASPLYREYLSGTLSGDGNVVVKLPGKFVDNTAEGKIVVAGFPSLQYAKQLETLVEYPHGCVEQTVSRVFPLLYFGDLAKLISPDLFMAKNPVYYVNEGIRKLQTMQLPDGSLSYWQGGTHASWWGSVYAAHFLTEAEKAGYTIPAGLKESLLNYLRGKVVEKELYDYVRYENGAKKITKVARKEIIYSLYVLSLAGMPDYATMNYYLSRRELLTGDTKYLLAGAYALAGQTTTYNDLLPQTFEVENAPDETGGSFDSPVRANAIKLNVLLETDPQNGQVNSIIRYLSSKTEDMYSTQEKAFSFLALGKAAKIYAAGDVSVSLSGENISGKYNGTPVSVKFNPAETNEVEFTSKGNGNAYYYISYEGVPVNPKKDDSNHKMKVTRKLTDYNTGAPIDGSVFRQGQLILCEITLAGQGIPAENIVITDMIPAGFEIENSRLLDNSRIDDTGNMAIDHEDIRDDRMILFTDLPAKGVAKYKYLLRVVNKGVYVYPGISAEAMYNDEFRSYNGFREITVK